MPHSPHDLGPTPPEPGSVQPSPGGDEPPANFDKVVEISNYTLSIHENGNANIILWSPAQPGSGIATLSFGAASTAGLPKEPTAGWPADGSVHWNLPFGALDAVLAILRRGDPPIRLHASGKDGDVAVWLSTHSKTRVASDDV
jgi:hypothetical protein